MIFYVNVITDNSAYTYVADSKEKAEQYADKKGKEHIMTDEQVELLVKALALFDFTIKQHNPYESNEFYEMVCALEKLTGLKLDY